MIRRLVIFLVGGLIWSAANAANCEEDMAAKFDKTWKEYYASALIKDGEEMEKYFNFSLKLRGVYDDEKPTLISKNFFLKNYSLIFVKNKVTKNTNFYVNFPKLKDNAISAGEARYLKRFCNVKNLQTPLVRFGPFIYEWFPKSGWKITTIFYDPDDKENLFDSVNNPNLEYSFP